MTLVSDIATTEELIASWLKAKSQLTVDQDNSELVRTCGDLIQSTWTCWLKCCDSLLVAIPSCVQKRDGISQLTHLAASYHVMIHETSLDRLCTFPNVLNQTLRSSIEQSCQSGSLATTSATLSQLDRVFKRFWLLLCGCPFTLFASGALPWSPSQSTRLASFDEVRQLSIMISTQSGLLLRFNENTLHPLLARLQSVLSTLAARQHDPLSGQIKPLDHETWSGTLRLPYSDRPQHVVCPHQKPRYWDFRQHHSTELSDSERLKRVLLRRALARHARDSDLYMKGINLLVESVRRDKENITN